ncbi:hypothetical protein G0U57_009327 [Chelydra serpentina]|uniref:Uncharacterized protein n=1 Tax=Chelydra serpentina TaxID=8475 RepID=A0A8T1SFT6_CHESE|nr:hypothetical protein G0U57_009327 [Chelydra serpentina]
MRRSRTALSFLSMERSRDSPDLGTYSAAPHVNAIKRRFSGTPLLPPLACRHVALSEAGRTPEPEGPRVVFTIEESRPSSGQEPGILRDSCGRRFWPIACTWEWNRCRGRNGDSEVAIDK